MTSAQQRGGRGAMTDAARRYRELLMDLLRLRQYEEACRSRLPQTVEAWFAATLDGLWREMTEAERKAAEAAEERRVRSVSSRASRAWDAWDDEEIDRELGPWPKMKSS